MPSDHVGMNVHLGADLLDWVVQAGMGWIRADFNWHMMEPEHGRFDWDATDAVVREAKARGLEIYATLAHPPSWATGDKNYPYDPDPLRAWVEAVAHRYHTQIQHYGVDNEPNAYLTPGEYLEWWLRPVAETLRRVDSAIRICGPELMTEDTDQGTWQKWMWDFWGMLRDTPLDIVTTHTYQKNGREALRKIIGPQTWWTNLTRQYSLHYLLWGVMRSGVKPLWLTEVGWSTENVSEVEQASCYDQLLESLPSPDMLEKVFFYQLVDEEARDGNPPVRWGILHEDLTPKLAYEVCRQRLQRVV